MGKLSYDDLIESIYECSFDSEKWDQALNQVRQHVNASAINLIGLEVATHDNPFVYTSNIPVDYGKRYQEHWFQRDPWIKSAARQKLGFGGATLIGNQLVDRHDLVKTDFYNDWLQEQDIQDVLSTNLWGNEPHWGKDQNHPRLVLCFMRGQGSEDFQEPDRLKLERLSRHLNRAFQMAIQVGTLARDSQLSQATLDALRQAVIVLDDVARIVAINATAQHLLNSEVQPFRVRQGRLESLGQSAHPSLDQALAQARAGVASAISFRCIGPDGSPCLRSARLSPLTERVIWGLPKTGGRFLLILDPGPCLDEEAFQAFAALFRLTRAEQSVLRQLMMSATAEEAAQELHVSLPTIRTHIQNLRHKTGVRRLPELINMALAATRGP